MLGFGGELSKLDHGEGVVLHGLWKENLQKSHEDVMIRIGNDQDCIYYIIIFIITTHSCAHTTGRLLKRKNRLLSTKLLTVE